MFLFAVFAALGVFYKKVFPFSANWLMCSSIHMMEYDVSLLVYWSRHRERHLSLLVSITDSWRREHDLVWVKYPPLIRPGGQGYKVAVGGPNLLVCMCHYELSIPYEKYPLHCSSSVLRAIALLDYCPTLAQKIMWRQEDKGLSRGLSS